MVVADALRAEVTALARDAGTAILAHYGRPIEVERKRDQSPLTLADQAAHGIIVEGLAALDGAIPVISEEGEIPAYGARRDWRRFWLVDPLDGTKEFIKRNGEFTVNIALVDEGEPVLGVIFAPALDLLYFATRDGGTWRESGPGDRTRIFSRARAPEAALTVVESRSHPSPEMEEFLRTVRVGARVVAGSSLKFCWVAEGRADVYPRFGPTMEWDVAAGDCIYRNSAPAGQRTSPLTYNKPDLRNEGFVIGLDAPEPATPKVDV